MVVVSGASVVVGACVTADASVVCGASVVSGGADVDGSSAVAAGAASLFVVIPDSSPPLEHAAPSRAKAAIAPIVRRLVARGGRADRL